MDTIRTRSGARRQRTEGQFSRACGCLNHGEYSQEKDFTYVKTSTCINRLPYKKLLELKLITSKCTWLCTACFDHSKDILCQHVTTRETLQSTADATEVENIDSEETLYDEPMTPEVAQSIEETESSYERTPASYLQLINSLISEISEYKQKWNEMPPDLQQAICLLGESLGCLIEKEIYNDGQLHGSDYSQFTVEDHFHWLNTKNSLLLAFLTGCTKVNLNVNTHPKKLRAMVHAVEQVMYTRNLLHISKFAFQRNFVSYSVTNSKQATKLSAAWEPSGSYTTLQKVASQPTPEPPCPEHDLHNTMDNNQKQGKSSGRIREGSKVPMSICTTVGHLQSHSVTDLQQDEQLVPSVWLGSITKDNDKKVSDMETEYYTCFRKYRSKHIDDIIAQVLYEQTKKGETFEDYVDLAVKQNLQKTENIVCAKCSFVYIASGTAECPKCSFDPDYNPIDYDPYSSVESCHPLCPPKMHTGEPCMVNPNGKDNVLQAMNHIRKVCEVPEKRKWTIVWSDGLPYLFAVDLQDNITVCNLCQERIDMRIMSKEEHVAKKHTNNSDVSFSGLLGDLLFLPGPGHIGLNMARLLLSFCWEPFLSTVALELGFRSPKAQETVRKGSDHHRSRQIISTSFTAISKELILPYVRACLQQGIAPTGASGYMAWVTQHVNSPRYMYLFYICFRFMFAFILYNAGTRKNNHMAMMAGRTAFAPIFYATRHPKYQKLHMRDMVQRAQLPPDLRKYLENHESFSVSGIHNRGQGADFVHEELNKLVKSFLPPGVPTQNIWLQTCRRTDELNKIKRHALNDAGEAKDYIGTSSGRPLRHEREITMIRREFRKKQYTVKPEEKENMTSLNGKPLCHGLANFKKVALDNYDTYKSELLKTGRYGGTKLPVVAVTETEKEQMEKLENLTKQEIKVKICSLLEQFLERALVQRYTKVINCPSYSRLTKDSVIDLYYEIEKCLNNQLDEATVAMAEPELPDLE